MARGRGIGSPVPRNSANHAIAELERSPRKRGRRRISYRHESQPLTRGRMIRDVVRGCPDRLSRSGGWPVVSWNAFRIRLHAPPFRPMAGAAHGKAESPRLFPNRLKRAVVSANQLLLFRPDLPRRREKPTRPRQQGHVIVFAAASAGVWPRNGSRSGQAGHLHASLQLRCWHSVRLWPTWFCDPHTETRRPPGVFACDEINPCGMFVTGQDTQALQIAQGERTRGERTRDLPGRQAGRQAF